MWVLHFHQRIEAHLPAHAPALAILQYGVRSERDHTPRTALTLYVNTKYTHRDTARRARHTDMSQAMKNINSTDTMNTGLIAAHASTNGCVWEEIRVVW